MSEVDAWRVAWFHPRAGHWTLGLYEYTDQAMAEALAAWYRADDPGVKSAVMPCKARITNHGVNR